MLVASALAIGPIGRASAAGLDDRTHAERSLAAIRASMAEIVRIEDGYDVGHEKYVVAAERARNFLVGHGDPDYVAAVGRDAPDGIGAIGHIDALLDRNGMTAWTPALQGAKMNLLAAVVSMTDALGETQMESYQNDLSQALADIALAIGRTSDVGIFGGIEGALASTTLDLPAGAHVVSGCVVPTQIPAYGVTAGRLAFVAVPRSTTADIALPQHIVVRRVSVRSDRVVFFTAQAPTLAAMCARAHHVALAPARVIAFTSMAMMKAARPVAVGHAHARASTHVGATAFTAAQAHAGVAVYKQNCLSCHGANLQGVAAPAVAGTGFLKSVEGNGWTFADMRNLVTQQMPLNNAGTLSPKAYAEVIAFLLASNCYPAGKIAFPEVDKPIFAATKISSPAAARPSNAKLGTCAVK